MAGWSASYVVPSTLVSALEANGSRINLDLSSANSSSLYVACMTTRSRPNVDTDPQSYSVAPWNTGESTGTNWAIGRRSAEPVGSGTNPPVRRISPVRRRERLCR